MTHAAARLMRLALQPAVTFPRGSEVVLAALRVLAGLLWLYNVSWKRAPDFGEDAGNGLYVFTRDAVEHPVFPPYSWVVESLVLPNFQFFGWMVLAVETALAVLLLTGTAVRLAALLGIAQSVAIALSVVQTPGEWPWAYWMMIAIHVVLLGTASGRVAGVDGIRAGLPWVRERLMIGWGALALVAGVVAGLPALLDDPFASSGTRLGGPDFSVGIGSYNVLGALGLMVVGATLVAAARLRRPQLGYVAAALAVGAALSLYAQLGFGDVWLGGSNTSAAVFLSLALIGAAAARVPPAERSVGGTPSRNQEAEHAHGAR